MSHFANGLKQLRIEHGLTQSALANELNVTQNAIFNWENEKREPNLDMIRKIAEYFNTSLVYLLDGKEEFKATPKFFSRDEKGDIIQDGKPPKFTDVSWSFEEAQAREMAHSIFDSILDEETIGKKREKIAGQIQDMLTSYNSLNDAGRKEAVKRVDELAELPRYTRPDPPQS